MLGAFWLISYGHTAGDLRPDCPQAGLIIALALGSFLCPQYLEYSLNNSTDRTVVYHHFLPHNEALSSADVCAGDAS